MASKKKTSGLKIVIEIEIGNDSMREYGELQQALANSIFAASALHPHDYAMARVYEVVVGTVQG